MILFVFCCFSRSTWPPVQSWWRGEWCRRCAHADTFALVEERRRRAREQPLSERELAADRQLPVQHKLDKYMTMFVSFNMYDRMYAAAFVSESGVGPTATGAECRQGGQVGAPADARLCAPRRPLGRDQLQLPAEAQHARGVRADGDGRAGQQPDRESCPHSPDLFPEAVRTLAAQRADDRAGGAADAPLPALPALHVAHGQGLPGHLQLHRRLSVPSVPLRTGTARGAWRVPEGGDAESGNQGEGNGPSNGFLEE